MHLQIHTGIPLSTRASIHAGMVSLHHLHRPVLGLSHTHMRHPHRAFFVGDVSLSNPRLYVAATRSLLEEVCAGARVRVNVGVRVRVTGYELFFFRGLQ